MLSNKLVPALRVIGLLLISDTLQPFNCLPPTEIKIQSGKIFIYCPLWYAAAHKSPERNSEGTFQMKNIWGLLYKLSLVHCCSQWLSHPSRNKDLKWAKCLRPSCCFARVALHHFSGLWIIIEDFILLIWQGVGCDLMVSLSSLNCRNWFEGFSRRWNFILLSSKQTLYLEFVATLIVFSLRFISLSDIGAEYEKKNLGKKHFAGVWAKIRSESAISAFTQSSLFPGSLACTWRIQTFTTVTDFFTEANLRKFSQWQQTSTSRTQNSELLTSNSLPNEVIYWLFVYILIKNRSRVSWS